MAWTAPKTWAVGETVTAAKLNTHIKSNLIALDQHTHDGSSGDGNDELTGLDHITFDDISAPSAPGSGKTRLYSVSGVLRRRSGASGADVAVARTKSGTYTGDGATSKAITGVGYQPAWVLATLAAAGGEKWHRLPNFAGTVAQQLGATAVSNDAIPTIDSDGFTVDDNNDDGDPNQNGAAYAYLVIE
jgi:hypothetical protein